MFRTDAIAYPEILRAIRPLSGLHCLLWCLMLRKHVNVSSKEAPSPEFDSQETQCQQQVEKGFYSYGTQIDGATCIWLNIALQWRKLGVRLLETKDGKGKLVLHLGRVTPS